MRIAAATALIALLLAGCGSNSHKKADAYASAVNLTQLSFAQELTTASNRLKASNTTGSDTQALDQAIAAVKRDVRKLNKIHPPVAVRSAHKQLVTAMEAYEKALGDVRKLVATSDPGDFEDARKALGRASTRVEARFSQVVADINDALA